MTYPATTVVITGANGFIGKQLIEHFIQKGWHVNALVRDIPQEQSSSISYFQYNLGVEPPEEAFIGADYLIHTAYVKKSRKNQAVYEINITGAKQLLKVSRKFALKRNIFISSMSANDQADSSYGKQKNKIESYFNKPEDTIVRPGLVIGNGGLVKQIVHFMNTYRVVPIIDGGDQPLQVIAIYDLVTAIDRILVKNMSGTFIIGTTEVYSYREFYLALRRELKKTILFIPVPFVLPLVLIRCIQFLHLPIGITPDNLYGLRKLASYETLSDLERLNINIDPLDVMLSKPGIVKH